MSSLNLALFRNPNINSPNTMGENRIDSALIGSVTLRSGVGGGEDNA